MPVRAINTSVISVLAIGLLAGSAVGVAAQDDESAAEEPTGASFFTGSLLTEGEDLVAEPVETVVDGVLEGRGLAIEGVIIETSDPRVSGSLSRVLNANIYKVGEFEDVLFETTAWRIENDGGSWSGQGSALVHGGAEISEDEATNLDTIVLTGEDGYEGLTAYVLADWTEDPVAVEGAVLVGEAPPPADAALLSESEAAE